ncbi:MAG: UDP-N-acetylmuramoylalanine-D-glutamate ligase, partial [uncultured bacterium]
MADQKTAIIGLGVTGLALLEYFKSQGEPVLALEEVSRQNFEKALAKYGEAGNDFYFGELPAKVYDDIKLFLISPGVPRTGQWVGEAVKREIPVSGELEFAACKLSGSLISVTGTNGKSTTVTLIQSLLQAAGIPSSLKGNIGEPLISAVTETPQDYYVVELSSYQLETVKNYHAKVAIVLNVTADHLDRYDSMDEYAL